MSWREQLLAGSFRGVPFGVESSEVSGGRRAVKHEFPFREDAPFTEDMGMRGRGFALTVFVVGDDYMAARDALQTALETPGPGELVHPYKGTKRVACSSYRIRETAKEGRFASFTIDFIETVAAPSSPSVVADAPGKVLASAAVLKTTAASVFTAAFNAASNLRASLVGAVGGATQAVNAALGVAAMPGQLVATITAELSRINATSTQLLNAPSALVESFAAVFEHLGAALLASGVLNPLAPLLAIYDFDAGTRPLSTTPASYIEQANFDAIRIVIQRLVLAQASVVIASQTFDSYDAALEARATLVDLIDLHCESTSDDAFPALEQSRTDVTEAVPGVDSDLPHLTTHTPRVTLPSVVLAYSLYGDLAREDDIVKRNKIASPGFVRGGVELEILIDE